MCRSTTLAIDFGSKYIGVALVAHQPESINRPLYAATLVVDPKPLKGAVETRAGVRRLRRTRKTHRRRLRRLAQALRGIVPGNELLQFCCRRGFSYEPEEGGADEQTFRIPREDFFSALTREVERLVPRERQKQVLALCERHLNRAKRPSGELRPARFENRGRARCNWEGCNHNVPRAAHDVVGRLQQSLFLWLQPVFRVSAEPQRLRQSVQHWIDELAGLAAGLRRLPRRTISAEEGQRERKRIDRRIRRIYQLLRDRVEREAPEEITRQFRQHWDEHYRPIVSEVVRGNTAGRVQFCREHSSMFVDHVMDGRPIPVRQELTAADLVSRRQQIVFERLARLIEGRLLPLAGGRIDEIVVERVAFDILSGPIKARQKLSEEEACDIYWHGPQAGFASRRQMLQAEFDGRCAYCGQQVATQEIEHVLHQAQFPFDSYFNLLPACAGCNARKAGRTALEAGLTVHDAAYEAYCAYLQRRKVLHPFQTIKKGILNLLRRWATVERGQQLIGMIADNLVAITNTQRSPRPLARYLATRLAKATGMRPAVVQRAARHTALYRNAALPDYDKAAQKEGRDLRNHAVDAIVLGCHFPSASALENRQWRTTPNQVTAFLENVRTAAPEQDGDGLPCIAAAELVPFFEEDAGNGYCVIQLSAFNWNRRRKASHKLDPFGKTKDGVPLKRVPAADVLAELFKGAATRDKQIKLIAHRRLRQLLTERADDAATRFVDWLQGTVRAGMRTRRISAHPADVARRKLLERFVNAPIQNFLPPEPNEAIPGIIGVKVLNADTGSARKVNVVRRLPNNPAGQFYQSEAMIKRLYVGYRAGDGEVDRTKPVLLAVSQTEEVSRWVKGIWVALDLPVDHVLRGRPLGASEPIHVYRKRWATAFGELVASEGAVKLFTLTQGCVIEKGDGSYFQLRNFDKSEPWMKSGTFKDIRRVYRTPFVAMRKRSN